MLRSVEYPPESLPDVFPTVLFFPPNFTQFFTKVSISLRREEGAKDVRVQKDRGSVKRKIRKSLIVGSEKGVY